MKAILNIQYWFSLRHAEDWLDDLQNDEDVGRSLSDLFHKSKQIYKKMPEIRRQLHSLVRTMEVPDAKLTIQALGRTRVNVGDKTLTMSDWQTQSVRDLFFYFLMMEKPITREQIGEVLWSDLEEPSRLKMRFKNDIYRLRRAVGSETIIYRDNLYSFNRTADYEYDVEAFESLLFQAKITKDTETANRIITKSCGAGQWTISGRYLCYLGLARTGKHQPNFLQISSWTCRSLKKYEQDQEALAAYKRAIDHDLYF